MDEDLKLEIEAAVEALKAGEIILYPTDTIWGLGCDATDKDAVARIFEIKQREDSKSLITLVSDLDMLAKYVKKIPEMALNLIEVNDKPMTIIYPDACGLAENVTAEDGSAGIRIPMHEFCKQMIKRFGRPIVSTSANISGEPAPAFFDEITGALIAEADHTVYPVMEEGSTGEPSQIILVTLDNQVKIIRG